jgi:hypothetical protein
MGGAYTPLFVTASLLLALLAAEPDWKRESAPDGVTLESRPVKDSAFYEYRAQADTDLPVATLCDAVFEWGSVSKEDHAHLLARTLVEDNGEARIVYDQIDPPVVSKRDLTFTVKRDRRVDGTCRIDFFSQNDKAPKLKDGFVRIEKLKGHWFFEPRGDAKARVTYQQWADPSGAIPAVFVHGSQREGTVETLKRGIARAHKPQKP